MMLQADFSASLYGLRNETVLLEQSMGTIHARQAWI